MQMKYGAPFSEERKPEISIDSEDEASDYSKLSDVEFQYLRTRIMTEDARRREEKDFQPIPKPKPNPDFDALKRRLHDGVRSIINNGSPGKGFRQYVFETAMETIYGHNIWEWWNKHNLRLEE